MKNRANQGSTLSLIVACTIVLALLGIGFIFLSAIFGGHREAQHAADSGALNVAKRAILAPSVPTSALSSDIGAAMAGALTPIPGIKMGTGVNLLTFNRMVAQAMMVGMNAEAEGSGQSNAKLAFDFVEGTSSQSIGAQLRDLLSNGSAGGWANQYYDEVEGNVLKMLGSQGAPAYQPSDFQVAYMNQRPGDFTGTNIDMSAFDPSNQKYKDLTGQGNNVNPLPITDYGTDVGGEFKQRYTFPSTAFIHAPAGDTSTSYMSGYTAIPMGQSGTYYGVPNNPGYQPHLESNSVFQSEMSPPKGKVSLPPNAFVIGAKAVVTQVNDGNTNAHVFSSATVGTPLVPVPFKLQIPTGYIVIDNSATGSFSGSIPNTDNVAAHELGTGGITVDTKTNYFSYGSNPNVPAANKDNGNLIDQWHNYKHTTGDPGATPPDYKGIFDAKGDPLKDATQASKIPYDTSSNAYVQCTDNNSSAPNGDPACIQLASSPPNGLDPFDRAYHPNSGQGAGGTMSTSQATAAELAQCKMIDLYGPTAHGGGPAENFPSTQFGPTGIRKYPNGLPSNSNQYAWQGPGGNGFKMAPDGPAAENNPGAATNVNTSSNNNSCQVTTDGTVEDYFKQIESAPNPTVTNGGGSKSVVAFLKQRMLEILSSAGDPKMGKTPGTSDIDRILQTPISLGNKYYISMQTGANGSQYLDISTTPPSYVGGQTAGAKVADGKDHSISAQFDILQGVANPYYAYGIHDRLFTTWGANAGGDDGSGSIITTETAVFTPASGAFGLLGTVTFKETSQAQGSLNFNNRD